MKEKTASSLEASPAGKGPGQRAGPDSEGLVRFRNFLRLSRKAALPLAWRAAEASRKRLQDIARNADPADRPLRRLLERIISEEEDQTRLMGREERAVRSTSTPRLEGPILEEILREIFISHVCPFGEGFLDRDAAMYFIESTTQELARFYSILAEGARDADLSWTFRGMAEAEQARLQFVRAVILGERTDGSAPGNGSPRDPPRTAL